MKNSKPLPTLFIVLRIVGFVLLGVGITLLIMGATKNVPDMGENGWFEAESAKSGTMFGGVACLMFGVFILITGFMPSIQKSISKVQIQTTSEIVSENKDDLKNIADTSAQVSSDAITTTTKAIKRGIIDTKYCKHCGAQIDSDSVFCKDCGGKQE